MQNIQAGETKEASRAYVFIIKKHTTDPNYLAILKKTEQVNDKSVSTYDKPEQKEENTISQN